jgi:hypothetical protein
MIFWPVLRNFLRIPLVNQTDPRSFDRVSTPLQKAIGWPERKYINDAGEKPANWGPFRQASGLDGIICRRVRADTA